MSKILIIEDEEAIADLERDYLELSGFEVEIANRGDVGLEKALKEEYDLTFADLWHDVQDGIPCYTELKKIERGKTRYWIEKTMQYYMKEQNELK